MVRSELLQQLCTHNPNLLRKDIKAILKIIFIEIKEALSRGESVEIRGFGIFKIVKRKARMGRNPKNAQMIQIPEKKAIKWKMSKVFFNLLNNNFTENNISDKY